MAGLPFSKPSVRLLGDAALAQNYLGDAYALLFRVRQMARSAGVPVVTLSQAIRGGSVMIHAMVAGTVERVTVDATGRSVEASEQSQEIYRGLAYAGFTAEEPEDPLVSYFPAPDTYGEPTTGFGSPTQSRRTAARVLRDLDGAFADWRRGVPEGTGVAGDTLTHRYWVREYNGSAFVDTDRVVLAAGNLVFMANRCVAAGHEPGLDSVPWFFGGRVLILHSEIEIRSLRASDTVRLVPAYNGTGWVLSTSQVSPAIAISIPDPPTGVAVTGVVSQSGEKFALVGPARLHEYSLSGSGGAIAVSGGMTVDDPSEGGEGGMITVTGGGSAATVPVSEAGWLTPFSATQTWSQTDGASYSADTVAVTMQTAGVAYVNDTPEIIKLKKSVRLVIDTSYGSKVEYAQGVHADRATAYASGPLTIDSSGTPYTASTSYLDWAIFMMQREDFVAGSSVYLFNIGFSSASTGGGEYLKEDKLTLTWLDRELDVYSFSISNVGTSSSSSMVSPITTTVNTISEGTNTADIVETQTTIEREVLLLDVHNGVLVYAEKKRILHRVQNDLTLTTTDTRRFRVVVEYEGQTYETGPEDIVLTSVTGSSIGAGGSALAGNLTVLPITAGEANITVPVMQGQAHGVAYRHPNTPRHELVVSHQGEVMIPSPYQYHRHSATFTHRGIEDWLTSCGLPPATHTRVAACFRV